MASKVSDSAKKEDLWSQLKRLPKWISISDIDLSYDMISPALFRVAPAAYVVAVDAPRGGRIKEDGPFLSMIAWAESDGAAKRMVNFDIEGDQADAEQHSSPPEAMLYHGCRTFGELIRRLREKGLTNYVYNGSYRISTDGKFVFRQVSGKDLEGFRYYFRSPDDDYSEKPFAISYRLS